MKVHGWIWLVVIALGLTVAAGCLLPRLQAQHRVREQALVAAALSGDAAAFESLRAGSRARALPLLEDFLQRLPPVNLAEIEKDLVRLASSDERVPGPALARLTLLPERADELFKARYNSITNEVWKQRLRPLVHSHAKLQKQIAGGLTGLYSEHFHDLFLPRRDALLRNHRDMPAQLFFAYAPFDETWSMLKNSPPDAQLRFLLLRLYAERDDHALEQLDRFSAADVLRVAAETWWPVELEPLAPDGAYRWATRAAAVDGNTATRLLRLSVRPSTTPGQPDEWLHLDRWLRWSYIFRYKAPILNAEAVVFAEGGVRKAGEAWRHRPGARQEMSEGKFWLPEPPENLLLGPGRVEAVRGVPSLARLPVAVITQPEAIHWHLGTAYEWARPLFPPALQTRLRFSPNEYPAPKVFPDADAAAQDTRKKPRRTRR